mgnify:CR=1 FL=1
MGRGTFIQDANAVDDKGNESTSCADGRDARPAYRTMARGRSRQAEANPLEIATRRLRSGVSKALFDIMPLAHKEQEPSLFEALGGKQTIVISSLSKTVASGLRSGWLVSSPARVRRLAELKRLMDHCTPTLIQGVALTMLTSGRYDANTAKMRALYRARMATLVTALEQRMPAGITWTRPEGGFSILVELPRGYSSVALLLSAIDRGVSFLPGPLFDIDQRYVNALRLSVAWTGRHQIQEGIELLASAIDDFIGQPPGDSGLSGLGNFQ